MARASEKQVHNALSVKQHEGDVCVYQADGKVRRIVHAALVLFLPSSFIIAVGYYIYAGQGFSREIFLVIVVLGSLLSIALACHAWLTSHVSDRPVEVIAWNRHGELIRLWDQSVDAGVCKLVRSRTEVDDTISGRGVYAFVYECECEKDGQTEVIELFWSRSPCGWKLKRVGKMLGFPVHGL